MKKKNLTETIHCPYCGAPAKLVDAFEIYGPDLKAENVGAKIYVCSNFHKGCDSYITTRKSDFRPRGTMANGDLRNLRIQGHQKLNKVVSSGIMTEDETYRYLASYFMDTQFHFGYARDQKCKMAIYVLDQLLEGKTLKALAR